ncbi:hypothetical protein NE850_29325 [Paraburkholderia sp. USG1]|uniref:hypothetical protein n=1 Tax=Paraburkholderia sp. USG1 TaxID=2952268 RepID=UPI002861B3A8|nr:hypothetical protein [Paraburkholderia sp. USG1]MDR8400418.1 hypothetical protein [Paraburkholderia sp. USG1]
MKKLIFAISLCIACGAHAAEMVLSIPAQFQGVWAKPSECQSYKESGVTDGGIEVMPSAIQQYETGCSLGKIIHADAITFTGQFACSVEGNTSSETISLKRTKGGLRYNDSDALSHCK